MRSRYAHPEVLKGCPHYFRLGAEVKRVVLSLMLVAGMMVVPVTAASASRRHRDDRHGARYRHDRSDYQDGYRYDRDDYQGRDEDGGYSYSRGRDRNGNEGDCQSGGCGNRSRRCEGSSGDCRSSFSPGPFDHSPVIIWFCPQQNSCNNGDGSQPSDQGGKQPPPR